MSCTEMFAARRRAMARESKGANESWASNRRCKATVASLGDKYESYVREAEKMRALPQLDEEQAAYLSRLQHIIDNLARTIGRTR